MAFNHSEFWVVLMGIKNSHGTIFMILIYKFDGKTILKFTKIYKVISFMYQFYQDSFFNQHRGRQKATSFQTSAANQVHNFQQFAI